MCLKAVKILLVSFFITVIMLLISCSKDSKSVNEPEEFKDPSDTIPGLAIVYLDRTLQVISGFGGVNMPGWTDVGDLTPEQVNTAFGTGDGQLGLSILRIRIPYDQTKFNLEIPTAKLAKSMGVTIIASPWSPPPALKTNGNIIAGYLKESSYADYAAHLKSFVDYMAQNGAPLYAVSIQNEPDISVTYESCDWISNQMVKFLKENAPAVGTKIIAPESYNFNPLISNLILNDPLASANVAIIGGHIYGGGINAYPLAAEKGKELWMTEHLDTRTSWQRVLSTAAEIDKCMYVGMNAYLWWYIRRFYGPIDEQGNVTKRGYIMSQYARFVRPGFIRVETNAGGQPQDYVYITAYKNGSKVVMVVLNLNENSVEQSITLRNGPVNSFTPYVTSETRNCEKQGSVNVTDGKFTATLEGESVTTFVSE